MAQKKIYHANWIVTSNEKHDVFENGFLATEGNQIIDVGPWENRPRAKSFNVVDVRYGMITPPLFNMHTHLAMSLLKGLAEDVGLDVWLHQYIFPAEKKFVSPSFVSAGTDLALCESIRNGVGYIADMYFHPTQVAKAFESAGVRGLVSQSFFDNGGMDTKSLDESLEASRKTHQKLKRSKLVEFILAPHAPYTCSPQTLKQSASLAAELDCGLSIHVAETQKELSDLKRQLGKTPLQAVQEAGLLEKPKFSLLAHMIWLEERDFLILTKHPKATPILNPQCNAKLASGYPPAGKYLNHRLNFSLGADGSASNNSLDLFSELNFLAKLQHLQENDFEVLNRKKLFDSVTRLAAKAVGRQNDLGSLEAGKKADFLIIDLQKAHLQPIYDPYSLLTYNIRGSDVDSLYIDGRCLMKKRKLLTLNEKQILSKALVWQKKLQSFFKNPLPRKHV